MQEPVIIVEYDPDWPSAFASLHRKLASILGDLAAATEHVGSTGVPGLAAKPILDVDVILSRAEEFPQAAERLAQVGYVHEGNFGVVGREAFTAPLESVPQHLYVCPPDSPELRRHLAFRDFLRAHPEAAMAYGDLKRRLAVQFRNDRDAYSEGKSSFVAEILQRAMGPQWDGG